MNINEDYLPLRDEVVNTLRQEILTGKIKPGERLLEVHIADRLGVSRTPVREAIRKLEQEGLVVMIPRRGAQVAEIRWKNLKDVLEVRRALDVLAIELACERMGEDTLQELFRACENFKQATLTKESRAIASADVALHDIIVSSTENDRLVGLVNNLSEQMYRYRFEYIKDESQHERLVQEHYEMYDAILRKDKESAARVVKRHIDNQEVAIIKQLQLEKK